MTSAEAMLETLGDDLGGWAYAVVGGLAFLETSAFVGLAAPGELAVVVGGVLAGRGRLELPALVAVVWLAATAGDLCGYVLGRTAGRGFLLRHGSRVGVSEARLRVAERAFARHGAKAVVAGRFVGVVRALGPFAAGASGMPAARFVAADVLGAGLWAATFTGLGYLFADRLGDLLGLLHRAQLGLGAALLTGLVVLFLVRKRRRAAGA
jgi:membrane protein DedA with SNARE-associated domain